MTRSRVLIAILLTGLLAVELRGQPTSTPVTLATAALKEGNHAEAVRLLTRHLEAVPEDHVALTLRAQAHIAAGDSEAADRDATMAIIVRPDYASAYFQRARALWRLDRNLASVADYSIYLRSNPTSASALSNRGLAWQDLNEFDRAEADFRAALGLAPNDATYQDNLNKLLLKRGGAAPPPMPDRSLTLPPFPDLPPLPPSTQTVPVAPPVRTRVDPVVPAGTVPPGTSLWVTVAVTIERSGVVSHAALVAGDTRLADAAVAAVRQWIFEPPLIDGRPGLLITTLSVHVRERRELS